MRKSVRRAIRDEKGAALALVLVLLVVGGLILTPLLGLMTTGLMSGQVYEKKTAELYAADAGVEDAIWMIRFEQVPSESWKASAERPGWQIYQYPGPLSVGNKSVEVAVYRKDWDPTCGENLTYQVLSTAVTDDSRGTAGIGSSTTIESYLDAKIVVRNLWDNAITSQDDINLGSNCVVDGDVQYGGSLTGGQAVTGNKTPETYAKWPSSGNLSAYYSSHTPNSTDPRTYINISGLNPRTIGPCHMSNSLTIDNSGGRATLTLDGTVYVDGDLDFSQPGQSSAYTINLNGQTIFATGQITFPANHVSISGSGCIIAERLVQFWPGMSGSPTDFVFVMSIESYVDFKPNGDFYGSLAGYARVDLSSNCHVTWTPWQEEDIDFPIEDYAYPSQIVKTLAIRTWEVNPE
jgi:Tfp pilus assembly protein PilX